MIEEPIEEILLEQESRTSDSLETNAKLNHPNNSNISEVNENFSLFVA